MDVNKLMKGNLLVCKFDPNKQIANNTVVVVDSFFRSFGTEYKISVVDPKSRIINRLQKEHEFFTNIGLSYIEATPETVVSLLGFELHSDEFYVVSDNKDFNYNLYYFNDSKQFVKFNSDCKPFRYIHEIQNHFTVNYGYDLVHSKYV